MMIYEEEYWSSGYNNERENLTQAVGYSGTLKEATQFLNLGFSMAPINVTIQLNVVFCGKNNHYQ